MLPYLAADLPGAGGLFKQSPDDFEVEEVPAYPPSGEGEHLFLWVEKRGVSTPELARSIARGVGISEDLVSYAGLKDRQAVTRQWLCVPARVEAKVREMALPEVRILEVRKHTNKLRTGHLRGNRFRIVLREVADLDAAEACFARLVARGVPNYFGEQRFGAGEENARFGKLLLRGERLPRKPDRFQRRMYLSAYQSLLFNRLCGARVEAGTLAVARLGDVLRKADTGGLFVCEDPVADQPRVDAFAVSPAGPIFGPKMTAARAEVGAEEMAMLASEGLELDDFQRGKDETQGARRPYRVQLVDPALERAGDQLTLRFFLPKGSYATVVLREVIKEEVTVAQQD